MRNRDLIVFFILLFFISAVSGCSSLYYNRVAPEAKDFHPKRIGFLSVDIGVHPSATTLIDPVISGSLTDKGWFTGVLSLEAVNQKIKENELFRKTVLDYLAKLKAVSYSDPELSKQIGEMAQIDAFVIVGIEYWGYSVNEKDDKIAKVGLNVQVIDTASGKIMWNASHIIAPTYLLIKPKLEDVAKDLFKKMIGHMPH